MHNRAIACPNCGSSDLSKISWNSRRCNHCGTESVLSDDRTRLELVGWRCPQCGCNNETDTTYCGKCGVALVKLCPKCLSQIREDLEFCIKCGASYVSERKALFQRVQKALRDGLKPEREVEYLNLSLQFAPDDAECLILRGQVFVQERQWRKAIADWAAADRSNPDDLILRRVLDDFIGRHIELLKRPGLVDARITDEKTRRDLAVIRSRGSVSALPSLHIAPFKPPRPPGKMSMALLCSFWPAQARRMEEIYETRLQTQEEKYEETRAAKEENHRSRMKEYEEMVAEREQVSDQVFGNRLRLSALCAEALEEKDERERTVAEGALRERQKRTEKREESRTAVITPLSKRKSSEERKEILSRQIQQAVIRGARIESQGDYMAVIVAGKKVNHILHFFLGIVTAGLWWIVWFFLIITGGEKRKIITVDEDGHVLTKKA